MGFIGATALFMAGVLWMMFFVVTVGTDELVLGVVLLGLALGLTLLGLGAWWVALRPDEREEDLFEGERGTGTAVVFVCAIALIAFFGWSAIHVDTWTDMYKGWTESSTRVRY
ncbi:MAG TPA: hypothetical protein VGF69_19965 [Thermoanaerobaculia bacterium]|jgi:hypothetical protein